MNYRLQGLEREADQLCHSLRKQGLMNCDLEVIGAILFTKYKGEDSALEELFKSSLKLRLEAEEFLRKLKEEI